MNTLLLMHRATTGTDFGVEKELIETKGATDLYGFAVAVRWKRASQYVCSGQKRSLEYS